MLRKSAPFTFSSCSPLWFAFVAWQTADHCQRWVSRDWKCIYLLNEWCEITFIFLWIIKWAREANRCQIDVAINFIFISFRGSVSPWRQRCQHLPNLFGNRIHIILWFFLYDCRSHTRNFRSWQLYAIMNFQRGRFVLKTDEWINVKWTVSKPKFSYKMTSHIDVDHLDVNINLICLRRSAEHRFWTIILDKNIGLDKRGVGIWRACGSCLPNLN